MRTNGNAESRIVQLIAYCKALTRVENQLALSEQLKSVRMALPHLELTKMAKPFAQKCTLHQHRHYLPMSIGADVAAGLDPERCSLDGSVVEDTHIAEVVSTHFACDQTPNKLEVILIMETMMVH